MDIPNKRNLLRIIKKIIWFITLFPILFVTREFIKLFKLFVFKELKERDEFRYIFGFMAVIIGYIVLILTIINQRADYFYSYASLIITTFILVSITSKQIKKSGTITGKKIFWIIIFYMGIVIMYVTIFAIIFIKVQYYNDGYFKNPENISPSIFDFLYISASSFLSMETNYIPQGFMKLAIVLEAFLAQFLILSIIFIIFGELFRKLIPKKDGKT